VVEFITLFLGALVAGPSQVQLQVDQGVAALEVRLDGQSVATLRGAPWELEVDFGEELAPHLLEAIAFAEDGGQIGRASQWINLTPKQTEVTIVLVHDRSAHRVEARLSWQSLSEDNEPVSARALFDGEPVKVVNPRAIELPPHDPDRLHHLSVELEFPGALRSAAEITFGGQYGENVSSGLTAFPVSLEGLRELPAIDEMQSWFRARGRPLRVHAAERGIAEIVVVRSLPAKQHLSARIKHRPLGPYFPILGKDHRLRFVGASPAVVARDQGPFVVFPRSEEIRREVSGLLQTLGSVSFPNDHSADVRLSDAVAVAGLFANRSARRRAVVLITTSGSNDASQFDPSQVRRYLERIGVPLVVWNPVKDAKQAGRWGAALNVSTDSLLDQAYRELSRALDQQRIVWLRGLHLPQTIVLDSEIEGVQVRR
jgi:hypothetical protein